MALNPGHDYGVRAAGRASIQLLLLSALGAVDGGLASIAMA